jgi:hypothetical protein
MRPARLTFLILFSLGLLGGIGNAWESSSYVKALGGNQIQETLKSLFSFVGIIDFVVTPTLFAIYVSVIVASYHQFVKPKVNQKFKILSIVLTVILGVLGQIFFVMAFYSLIS